MCIRDSIYRGKVLCREDQGPRPGPMRDSRHHPGSNSSNNSIRQNDRYLGSNQSHNDRFPGSNQNYNKVQYNPYVNPQNADQGRSSGVQKTGYKQGSSSTAANRGFPDDDTTDQASADDTENRVQQQNTSLGQTKPDKSGGAYPKNKVSAGVSSTSAHNLSLIHI